MANVSKRAIYNALINLASEGLVSDVTMGEGEDAITVTAEDVKTFALNEIALLDKRNAQRASKPTKSQAENAETLAKILDKYPQGAELVASVVGVEVGVSTSKASSILRLNPDKFEDMGEVRVEKGKSKVHVYKVL